MQLTNDSIDTGTPLFYLAASFKSNEHEITEWYDTIVERMNFILREFTCGCSEYDEVEEKMNHRERIISMKLMFEK